MDFEAKTSKRITMGDIGSILMNQMGITKQELLGINKEVMKPTLFHLVKQTLSALKLLSSSMRNTCLALEKLGRQMRIQKLLKIELDM